MTTQRSVRRMSVRVLAAGAAAAAMMMAVPVAASAAGSAGAARTAPRAALAQLTFRCADVSGDSSRVEGRNCTPNQQGPIETSFIIQSTDLQDQWECANGFADSPLFVQGYDCEAIS